MRAGSRELPKWLHFDEKDAQFTGVPLLKDKGQMYISVDGYATRENGNVLTESTLFSLTILTSSVGISLSTEYRLKYSDFNDRRLGCDHSTETGLVECLPSEERVLANILFLVSFDSLTPLERAELFKNSAMLFDTCLERLELRVVNWTNTEGVWLWSKLATGEIIDTLESATILSFLVGCENFDLFGQSSLKVPFGLHATNGSSQLVKKCFFHSLM